ncbi:nuclear transport factor 2 family protein [Mycobacterium sp.]|uniref:nuclear transport factor 2 family protein n=1 Tax=Mycobacterium sp. TaxID=1785 RepID=UPI0039C9A600
MLSATERIALTDLVHRYAAGVDDRQFDSVTELFTETAELILPEPPTTLVPVRRHIGHAAIRTAVEAVSATIRTEHAIVGEVFDAGQQPDSARGRIACVAHHWSRHGDQLTDVVWHLRYDDEYRRTDAGWRITLRALTINAIETRSARRVLSAGQSE